MQKRPSSSAIAVIVGAFLLFPMVFFVSGREPLSSALEPSWQLMLGFALTHSLAFGQDVVFTYGPLGFLVAKYGLGDLEPARIVGGLLLAIAIVIAAARLIRGVWWPFVALMFAWLIVGPGFDDHTYPAFFFTTILVAAAVPSDPSPSTATVTAAGAILGLIGLTKVSFLFLAFPLVVAGLVVFLAQKHVTSGIAWFSSFVLAFVGGWIVFGQDPAAIPDYLRNSAAVSSGYTGAMSLLPKAPVFVQVCLATATTAIAGLALLRTKGTGFERAHRTIVLFAILAVAWKSAVVRADRYHIDPFVLLLPVLCFFAVREFLKKGASVLSMVGSALTLAMVMALAAIALDHRLFKRAGNVPALYAESFRRLGDVQTSITMPVTDDVFRALDNQTRRSIGHAPIDVFGYHQGAAMITGLSYEPRPVFQSYFAYTPLLQKKNLDHYLGSSRPSYVLFNIETIDGRFPTLDDASLLIHLLGSYEPITSLNGPLLLRRRISGTPKPTLTPLGRFDLRFGQPLRLPFPTSTRMVARVDMNLSFAGRFVSLLFQAPPVRLRVKTADGNIVRYTFVPDMARSGFLLSPLVQTASDVYGPVPAHSNKTVDIIQFVGRYASRLYREPVRVELFELTP